MTQTRLRRRAIASWAWALRGFLVCWFTHPAATESLAMTRVFNFSPGPATMPESGRPLAARGMHDRPGRGRAVREVGRHRQGVGGRQTEAGGRSGGGVGGGGARLGYRRGEKGKVTV